MRVEFNHGPQPAETTQTSARPATAESVQAEGSRGPLGEDQAQLSGVHAQVQALAAQAAQLPEVRQEKVQALRQALEAGRYQVSPEKVAGAVLAERIAGPAA